MPKISVIVPVYNAEKYLRRCVDSILAQTFTDFELLLIDDGSKDNSLEICNEYAANDTRVKVFHKENGGASSARNVGLEFAQGDFIMFCDSDDELVANSGFGHIAKDIDLIVYGFDMERDSHVNQIRYEEGYKTKLAAFKYLLTMPMPGSVWNKVFRKSIITDNNLYFNTDLFFREDEEFLLRYLAVINNVYFSRSILYMYYSPNLSVKYMEADNFWCDFSMFKSANQIIEKGSENPYLGLLTNAFFNSFDKRCSNLLERTIAYKSAISNSAFVSVNLSMLTSLVLKAPSLIVYITFIIKSFLYNIVGKRNCLNR